MGGNKKRRKSPQKQPIVSNNWLDWRFWCSLVVYFLAFSWLGHWMEIAVFWFNKLFTGGMPTHGIFDNWLEPYWVYGCGAVACVLLLYPLNMRIGRQRIFINYLINTVTIAIIEYVAGWVLVFRFGSNYCWDYSENFLNLHGQICLQNTLLFGAAATIFTLWVYPWFNSFFSYSE